MNAVKIARAESRAAQFHAQLDAPKSLGEAKHRRVLVRRAGRSAYTTVSVPVEWYERALHFAGNERLVSASLRRAALHVHDFPPGHFSDRVRTKALAALRGNYRPNALGDAQAAEARLAVDNNTAWATAG